MTVSPLAGKQAPAEMLIDVDRLVAAYFDRIPNVENPVELVSFGTSGHRGSSLNSTFNEQHVLAITQAIVEYRNAHQIDGPLLMGKDTHALSGPAQDSAIEVLAANNIEAIIQGNNGVTPTPVISHAILTYNKGRSANFADGIVVTPSHNPPEDGGFKYNPPNGGPADTTVTDWIQNRANDLMRGGCKEVKRIPLGDAKRSSAIREEDLVSPYVADLNRVVDMDIIRESGLRLGVDPLGGASIDYWGPIAEKYRLNLTISNPIVDPRFAFMTVDHDGKIRMDCSSPYAMARLVNLKDQYRLAFGNDPDADRHGIVTPGGGLMNPNHFLAVAIDYLLTSRTQWSADAAIGKTLVSSSMIDKVVSHLGRRLMEAPVGFKWFAPGLLDGTVCFGGEESAGASYLNRQGKVWTTDKDGMIMDLLAAEITARTGKDPAERFAELESEFGTPYYTRIDASATPEQKSKLKALDAASVRATELAGEEIVAKLTEAPGNHQPIGGLKVVTANGWFAARPSGTENIYKIYAESFVSEKHLDAIVEEAQQIVNSTIGA